MAKKNKTFKELVNEEASIIRGFLECWNMYKWRFRKLSHYRKIQIKNVAFGIWMSAYRLGKGK